MASKHWDKFRLPTKAIRGECDVKEFKVLEAHFITQGVSPRRDGSYCPRKTSTYQISICTLVAKYKEAKPSTVSLGLTNRFHCFYLALHWAYG